MRASPAGTVGEGRISLKKRIVYLDFLRCFAILLVIVLHSIANTIVNPAFYQLPSWYLCMAVDPFDRAAVPLFFMISGALLLNRSGTERVGAFYRHNLPKLLVPLAAWSVIYYFFYGAREGRTLSLTEFLGQLLGQGVSFHMWFIYSLLGLYLLCPFLKRVTDQCTVGQLAALLGVILFPTTICPILNGVLPFQVQPFDALVTGWAGYFLLGCLLDRAVLSRTARILLYLGGAAGYGACLLGNLAASSSEAIPLPMDGGCLLNHYLLAAAIFVLARTFFHRHSAWAERWSRPLAGCSELVFGVYWVHVLILYLLTDLAGQDMSILAFITLRLAVTIPLSFVLSWGISVIPGVRRVLQ